MANLPTMSESKVSRNNSLEKVLPVMAKDISIMKTSLIKFMKSQTSQQSKAEAYFQRAKQKENLYESRYAKKSPSVKSSTSPTKSGDSGTGLFDSKVGLSDFLKRLFNILTKGLLVGGAVFGLKKLLEDPEIRKNMGDFLKDIFVGILGLVRDGAKLFTDVMQKNGPEIQKALTETFVAIMGAIEEAIKGLTNLLTGPNSKEIYDSIGRVFTAIGDAIVKVFTTKIDIKGIEVPLGLVIAGLAALPAVLRGFSLAITNATAALLGFSGGKGAAGAVGGILSMISGAIRTAIAAALLAYAGSEAYNAWKKKNPDKDTEGNPIDPKSQLNDRMIPGAYDQQTGYLDSGKLAVGAAEVAGGVYVGKKAIDLIKSGRSATVPTVPSTSPSVNSGFPRGPAPSPTTAELPISESKIIPQKAGSGPRDYERIRSMGQAAEGMYSGKRAPLPPKEESMIKKIVERIKSLSSKGSKYWGKFIEYVTKRVVAHYGSVKGATVIGAKLIGAIGSVAAAPVTAGISTFIGYGLLAADIYFLYTVIEDFFKEQKIDNTPTQAITPATSPEDFRDQMVQGANSPNRYREESIDTGDARSMAENYLGRKMSDKEWNELVRATYAEGSGKSTEEYALIMAAILNRSRMKGGKDISEILREPGQFEAVTGGKNPRWNSGRVNQRDYDMITSGTSILDSINHNLDSFGASNLAAYQNKSTGERHLANLLNSGGMRVGDTTFGFGLYGGSRPTTNPSASIRLDSNQVNVARRNLREVEDSRNDPIQNIINSFNTNNSESKQNNNLPTAPVASPYNEEQFFEAMVKSIFV